MDQNQEYGRNVESVVENLIPASLSKKKTGSAKLALLLGRARLLLVVVDSPSCFFGALQLSTVIVTVHILPFDTRK